MEGKGYQQIKILRREDKKFVRPGEKKRKTEERQPSSYLDGALGFTLSVDLNGKPKFPRRVAVTKIRPDMLLLSENTKRVGIVELTVPSEDRVELSGELKDAKYEDLKSEGERRVWRVRLWSWAVWDLLRPRWHLPQGPLYRRRGEKQEPQVDRRGSKKKQQSNMELELHTRIGKGVKVGSVAKLLAAPGRGRYHREPPKPTDTPRLVGG